MRNLLNETRQRIADYFNPTAYIDCEFVLDEDDRERCDDPTDAELATVAYLVAAGL